tara:strand:+ start:1029 stop:1694 length:666 start_codon:yes stop_codon:yes gene_type:complete
MFILHRYKLKKLVWLVLILTCLSFILFHKYKNKISRQLYYNNIYHNICSKNDSDSLKIIKCFEYVANNIEAPGHFIQTKGLNPKQIIEKGYGSCDQQSNLLITLLEKGGFPGKLVFLLDNDSISLHSVCEIKIGDRNIMLDPFYKVFFYNKNRKMASLSDISIGNIINQSESSVPRNYLELFNKEYPKKIFRINRTKKIHQTFNKIIFNVNYILNNLKTYL